VRRDGIEHVSVRNVAAEAGLSMGSLRQEAEPRRVLHQLVPMTPEARVEHQIWLAFVGKVTVDPALHELSNRIYDDTRALIARLDQQLAGAGGPGQGPPRGRDGRREDAH
jgi:hypothetical protein